MAQQGAEVVLLMEAMPLFEARLGPVTARLTPPLSESKRDTYYIVQHLRQRLPEALKMVGLDEVCEQAELVQRRLEHVASCRNRLAHDQSPTAQEVLLAIEAMEVVGSILSPHGQDISELSNLADKLRMCLQGQRVRHAVSSAVMAVRCSLYHRLALLRSHLSRALEQPDDDLQQLLDKLKDPINLKPIEKRRGTRVNTKALKPLIKTVLAARNWVAHMIQGGPKPDSEAWNKSIGELLLQVTGDLALDATGVHTATSVMLALASEQAGLRLSIPKAWPPLQGRDEFIDRVVAHISASSSSRTSIHGDMGIGKSALAGAVVTQLQERAVFHTSYLVRCSTLTSATTDLLSLAR